MSAGIYIHSGEPILVFSQYADKRHISVGVASDNPNWPIIDKFLSTLDASRMVFSLR